jgi:hypothetical protein
VKGFDETDGTEPWIEVDAVNAIEVMNKFDESNEFHALNVGVGVS